ncbi:LuxR C-terminal-related transcriptional regulator [Cetobacterium sp.]|uniref:LuxR C-terminal-related transcriptional regulator n=1 Tax=Cetobacterium sp. TaxID=2071632 RepID=UPI003F2CFB90
MEIKLVIELMYDMIELILSPREFEIYLLSKNKKPRHIAKELGLKNQTVRIYLVKIRKKINIHNKWVEEKIQSRGLKY